MHRGKGEGTHTSRHGLPYSGGGRIALAINKTSARPWLLLAPSLAVVMFLLIIPVGFIISYSFWQRTITGLEVPELHLGNWTGFFTDNFYHYILWQTLRYAAISTALCVILGYVPAYFLSNTKFKNKALLVLLLLLPFWVSYIIRTMSWIHILGSHGVVNLAFQMLGITDEPIRMLYVEFSVIMGFVHAFLPFMILNLYVSLEGMDKNLVEAARSLGCTGWQAFREVTLPLSLPGLAAGSLLVFVLTGGSYITPMILGGPDNAMFAGLIFETIIVELDWPFGSTMSIVLLVVLGSVVVLYSRFMGLSQVYKSFG
jgi:spermidine/putrescine transport system permease protein